MVFKKCPMKFRILMLLFFITLYGLITFLYLEISVMVRVGGMQHVAEYRLDLMKFKRGKSHEEKRDIGHDCPYNFIPAAHNIPNTTNDITCKLRTPSTTSCTFAEIFYKYDYDSWKCNSKEEIRICELNYNHQIVCDYKACGSTFIGEVVLHLFDVESGLVRPTKRGFYNSKELTENVIIHAQITMREGYPFLFLSCDMNERNTQLLIFDNSILRDKTKTPQQQELSKLNINIFLFDSISRAHFYRSLKQTINFLGEVNTDPAHKAEILDFELFQSVHGHTTENLYALMNGKTFPVEMSDQDKESGKTYVENMLGYVKAHGYEILYQEDECWQGTYGIFSDLGNFGRWKDFHNELTKNTSIDDTGLSYASCKMIDLYEPERKHIFNTDGDIKICYNGLNLDAYYLQYVANKLKATKNHPLFSFTAINIAHDGIGRRVQGIDADMKTFFKQMTEQENTITILFADHGNGYTDFVYLDMEGRYEIYHPALFMVIPDKVRSKLGKEKIHALRMNQKRLMTLVDVHHMVKHIIDPIDHPQKGLLEIVPADRSCDNIPMGAPNLCICQGWASPVKNTTEYMPHLDFAVGVLNNVINAASTANRCKRIVPTRFENLMQKKTGESLLLTFDIFTTPGIGSNNKEEQFRVELNYAVSNKNTNFNAKLLSSDRISQFGEYRKCSDAFEKFRLCICDDMKEHKELTKIQNLLPIRNEFVYTKIFGDDIEENISFIVDNKLAILERTLYEIDGRTREKRLISVTFEALSIVDTAYVVELNFGNNLDNMKPMAAGGCTGLVKRHGMTFLCVLMRVWSIGPATYKYNSIYNEVEDDPNDVLLGSNPKA